MALKWKVLGLVGANNAVELSQPQNIGNKEVKALISQGKRLTHLDVSGSKIDKKGISLLPQLPTLISFKAHSCNKLGDDSAELLSRNTNLTSLELSECQISKQGAEVLATSVTLLNLDLSGCKIGNEGAKAFANNSSLTSLSIARCNVTDEGVMLLATNRSLTSLSVGYNAVYEDGLKVCSSSCDLLLVIFV